MKVTFQKDSNKENWFLDKSKILVEKIKNFKLPSTFYYFIVLLAIGLAFYILMLAENSFTLAYGGDYMAQYIPMGYHVWDYYHEWIRTGHFILYDSTIYLGVNSIGSNAYYGLFSPFNIIIVLFPRSFVPQAVAISSIVKLACAGLFFNYYMLHTFKVKDNIGRLCGVAYAFCGWGAFYLWYNNYQDILVFFPLVLLGIEKTIKEFKPWLLAVGVFFLTICNYVLMVPYVICAFFYAMFRFFQQIRSKTAKENFLVLGYGVIGFIGGVLLGFFVFFPAFMATVSSPKLNANSYGGLLKQYLFDGDFKSFFELIFSWGKAQDQHGRAYPNRVYYPILEFFFPPTTCRSLPTLELYNWDFDDMAVSLWCYVPFIMFLVPALIQSGKDKKWSHFIGFALLVLSLFTPFMYFLTMGFTNGYARWTLFVITSLLAYVGTYIDRIPNVAKWHIHVGYTFAVIGIVTAWILTWKLYSTEPSSRDNYIHRFVEGRFDFTNIAYILELVYVTGVYLALFFTYNKKAFHILTSIFITAEAIAVGNFVTIGHGYDTRYNNGYQENERFRNLLLEVQKNDPSFYRLYTSISDDYSVNNGFMNNYNSTGFFHSLYNFEVNDFTLWTGMRSGVKSVGGIYRGKYQDVDNLLGVKYYFISKEKSRYNLIEKSNPNGYIANVPFDFTLSDKYIDPNDEYLVYENNEMGDFGYAYSKMYDNMFEDTSYEDSKGNRQKYGYYGSIGNIRNAIVLATDAVFNKDDVAEIKNQYPNLIIDDKAHKPVTTSLKELRLNTNYLITHYDISSAYIKDEMEAAKYYPFEKITNIPNDFEPATYDAGDGKNNRAMDFFAFYNNPVTGEPLFKSNTSLYIQAEFSGSEKYDFYFIDKDNKIFMYDCHDDNSTDNTSNIRGFYIKKDVYKLAVVGKYYKSYLRNNDITIYSENKSYYDTRRNALNAHKIENAKYQRDKFTFDTHYDENLIVVSRVAYDKGWSITAKNNDTGELFPVKTYNGNGGFVSFVAPKGNISYTMTYQTPYLNGSLLITAFSATTFFVSLLGYHFYQEKKRTHHLDNIFREN